jgi:hypothetical protein
MSLLPDDEGLELIHTREYETKVYRISDDELLVRGAVADRKPPGLYVVDDPEPLEIHQMQLELRVAYPSLEITAARVLFETHPHSRCPLIAADYEKLVGLSVARGFTRKTRELFGGPNGCTHTNALIQAMAPAIVQATWSIHIQDQLASGRRRSDLSLEERAGQVRMNLNTCHVWDERSDRVQRILAGETESELMLPVAQRLAKLGRKGDPNWS